MLIHSDCVNVIYVLFKVRISLAKKKVIKDNFRFFFVKYTYNKIFKLALKFQYKFKNTVNQCMLTNLYLLYLLVINMIKQSQPEIRNHIL